jgi:hypothetical protein
MTICVTSTTITAIYFTFYLALVIFVMLRNKFNFNKTKHLVCILFFAIYCLQLAAASSAVSQEGCLVNPSQKFMLFESDILIMTILQMVLYRMMTLKQTLSEKVPHTLNFYSQNNNDEVINRSSELLAES